MNYGHSSDSGESDIRAWFVVLRMSDSGESDINLPAKS